MNTALGDLVSIQFMLSRDSELPRAFSILNRYGMPRLPLLVAAVVPAFVLVLFPSVEALADLYAVGVVGAIGINLGSTSTDPNMPLRRGERLLMLAITAIMIAIEATICVVKPHARAFALIVLVLGLSARLVTVALNPAMSLSRRRRLGYLVFSGAASLAALFVTWSLGDSWLSSGLLATLGLTVGFASATTNAARKQMKAAEIPDGEPQRSLWQGVYVPKEQLMVATQGNPRLIEFAIRECKSRQAELQLLFVRHIAVTPMGENPITSLSEDAQALALFDEVRDSAHKAGVPLRLLYSAAYNVPEVILDMAVTHGADLLLLGTSRRGTLWRTLKGDIIQGVAEHLPENVGLLIHA